MVQRKLTSSSIGLFLIRDAARAVSPIREANGIGDRLPCGVVGGFAPGGREAGRAEAALRSVVPPFPKLILELLKWNFFFLVEVP